MSRRVRRIRNSSALRCGAQGNARVAAQAAVGPRRRSTCGGGRRGIEGWAVYNATKFAVVGLHDALRKELGPEGIRVSLIEPGSVYTEWGHNVPAEQMKARRDSVQALHAEDIAQALLWAFVQPPHVNALESLILPTRQVMP